MGGVVGGTITFSLILIVPFTGIVVGVWVEVWSTIGVTVKDAVAGNACNNPGVSFTPAATSWLMMFTDLGSLKSWLSQIEGRSTSRSYSP